MELFSKNEQPQNLVQNSKKIQGLNITHRGPQRQGEREEVVCVKLFSWLLFIHDGEENLHIHPLNK